MAGLIGGDVLHLACNSSPAVLFGPGNTSCFSSLKHSGSAGTVKMGSSFTSAWLVPKLNANSSQIPANLASFENTHRVRLASFMPPVPKYPSPETSLSSNRSSGTCPALSVSCTLLKPRRASRINEKGNSLKEE
jgi:hypothetical protein